MTLELAPLIEKYGYLATLVGTLAEGETLLILSGLAAHRGYLALPLVVLVGAVGGTLGDIFFFLLGRHYGPRLLTRFPRFAPAADRVRGMIERFPSATILGVRFLYGLRIAGPAIIGTTRVSLPHFLLLNLVGAVAWSICWAVAGYVLGQAAEALLGDLARVERELFAAVLVIALVGVVVMRLRRGRGKR